VRGTILCFLLAGSLVLAGCKRPAAAPAAAAPQRLAVMGASAAEMLDGLGLLDRVVAVGDFVDWPPRLRRLPKLGSYDAPNEEEVLALRTDLLITSASKAARTHLENLRRLGVEVMELETDTFDSVLASLHQLAARLGREPRARELERRIRSRMAEIRGRTAAAARPRVLFVVGQEPLYVAGPGSFVDEMIRAAGGQNVAADARSPYQLVSLEAMLGRLPEVIIDISDNRPDAVRGRRLGSWERWSFLPAVARRQVYSVDPDRLSIAGPRLPEMTELVGKLIHPEIFGAPAAAEMGPLAAGAS